MNEKDDLLKQELQSQQQRHFENLMKAQEQASLIASSNNLEIDDLSQIIQNEAYAADNVRAIQLTPEQKIQNAVRNEIMYAQNEVEEYEGYSGLTEMARNKEAIAEKKYNSVPDPDAIVTAK